MPPHPPRRRLPELRRALVLQVPQARHVGQQLRLPALLRERRHREQHRHVDRMCVRILVCVCVCVRDVLCACACVMVGPASADPAGSAASQPCSASTTTPGAGAAFARMSPAAFVKNRAIVLPLPVAPGVSAATRADPTDKRCGCPLCPSCRPGQPCPQCDGGCVVCQAKVRPAPLNPADVASWRPDPVAG